MKKIKVILSLLIIVIAIGFLIAKKDGGYSATDVLENANFTVENPSITIHTVDTDKEDIYTRIKIPEETQKRLLQAFQNAKFDKATINPVDYDYRITISLNTGYTMYLVSEKRSLTVNRTEENYTMVNDNDFFSILEKVTK
ncbi:hypothetical protein [Lysinibacillus fusiformis]|uniref:hypothetical protein n=2 Tax=Lysinibacillus fusiformis TaxID=28031 RepID=UPI000321FD6B|nr:hypothetical protein [Lysinibacillus fusiformis]MCG7437586.1 hypothetical protein [Lysinibacillus fusiformis]MED4077775.1 hypothetical protein [Lysinibacillus fusiformis]PCD82643.1 hypothetical protein CNQ87_18945 [Lysinibacillus fusiformis]SCX69498.1 hypothetical protein SAMN02787108_04551 [Lysinibacillus fusiformis]SDB58198.1 hypothetical protein SAMN02787070_04538 [Lysinibacillus fusiformis]